MVIFNGNIGKTKNGTILNCKILNAVKTKVSFNKSAPVTTSYYVAGCDSNGFFWLENEYYGEYFKEGQVYAWKEIK